MSTSAASTVSPLGRQVPGLEVEAPPVGRYTIDAGHTEVGFVARHLMVTKVRGRFADVSGEVTIAEDPLDSSVEVRVATASITTGSQDRDAHLRSADFLDVDTHPELRFASTGVRALGGNRFAIDGELTIRGVTRAITLDTAFEGVARDPWGGTRLAVSGTTEIDREDWGLTWNVALDTGGVLVSRTVRLEIEAQAVLDEGQDG